MTTSKSINQKLSAQEQEEFNNLQKLLTHSNGLVNQMAVYANPEKTQRMLYLNKKARVLQNFPAN
jgi:hypothetical protein